ncbi:MAG: NAD-dependent deacetylase [Longimicrobiales bacterium]
MSTQLNSEDVARARGLLEHATRVFILTGAGISAESGVPTFRGEDGLWRSYRPEELATPQAFRRDPRLVWAWYGWRREKVADCKPNAGHAALARLALDRPARIVTQNVDGLHEVAAVHEAAGADWEAASPLELHGSLFRVRCTKCVYRGRDRSKVDATDKGELPSCPKCGALLRPDIVWFGEALDPLVLTAAFDEAREADLCLVVGTSAVVQPAASLPRITRDSGGSVIEVNPQATPLTDFADVALQGPAGVVLPTLIQG